jgi:hypothetical protein
VRPFQAGAMFSIYLTSQLASGGNSPPYVGACIRCPAEHLSLSEPPHTANMDLTSHTGEPSNFRRNCAIDLEVNMVKSLTSQSRQHGKIDSVCPPGFVV